jgi:type I restriction enzyme M protein
LLKNGATKDDVKKYVNKNYYDVNFKLDDIRDNYYFDVSCKGSVPQAIVAFLESNSFEDAIRNAISIGGDSDTIGAMAGSLAEAFYGIPNEISNIILKYLDDDLKYCLSNFYDLKEIKKIR